MNERLIHLRVKVKSLEAEAKIIRAEARKTEGMVKWRLNDHRTQVVRHHTRHNLLAYGLLKGVLYEKMEKRCYRAPDLAKIEQLAKRFGGDENTIATWIYEAKTYIERERDNER